MATAGRRTLAFNSIGDIRRDVDELLEYGYSHLGRWNLTQTCFHLGIFIQGSMDGLSEKPPWFFRPFGGMIYRRIISTRRMPQGVKIPQVWVPGPMKEDPEKIESFRALLRRFENHHGEMAPNPLFGRLTKAQWCDLHLIHCGHHLSFLVPSTSD